MDKARRGQYQESINDFNLAIRSNPNYSAAFKFRGIAYSKLRDKQKAFYDFKQAAGLYLSANDVESYHNTIQLLLNLKISESDRARKFSYRRLQELLLIGNWQEADKETLSIMLQIVGREKQAFLSGQDIKNFPSTHLHIIDQLWMVYSNGHFGFRVKKQIWQSIGGTSKSDSNVWRAFGDRVGWRVKYDSSFVKTWIAYSDFNFTLDAPAGHLPTALPGRRYSFLSVIASMILLFLFTLFVITILGFSSSYFISGFVGLFLVTFNTIYNGSQQYTKEWWQQLFSRAQICGI
jgi:hypothetical protein